MAAKVEERIAALDALRERPLGAAELALVRRELGSKQALVVAAAARVVGAQALEPCFDELEAAFARLLDGKDPQCLGKLAIAEALSQNEAPASDTYLAGLHHVQLEPVWGGRVDSAGPVRATCAIGLVRMAHPDAPELLADLLADPERAVRQAAARGFGFYGNPHAAVPLLRFKALLGDEDGDVTREILASLLALSPTAIDFVAALLDRGPAETTAAALLAIGESRHERAAALLIAYAERQVLAEHRSPAYVALSLVREAAAFDYVLDKVANAPAAEAEDALGALAPHRYDPELRARIRATVETRSEPTLRAACEQLFAE